MPENLGLGVGIGSVPIANSQGVPPIPQPAAIYMENGGWVQMESSGNILLE